MKALVAYNNHEVKIEEVDKPEIEDNDSVLLKVKGTGICGTDHIFFNDIHLTQLLF